MLFRCDINQFSVKEYQDRKLVFLVTDAAKFR